jgi:photosystem II stability/assembly factor-like uncharacterized protein
MEQLPKIVREGLQTGAKAKIEVHPDADLLTAFAENSLIERERLPVLEHLSSCADCREVVSLAQPELVVEHAAAAAAMAAPPAPSRPRWSSRLIFSWGAVAACVVIGVVLLQYQTREKKFAQIATKENGAEVNAGQTSNAEESPAKAKAQTAAPAAENELTAKLEPPVPVESRSARRTDEARAGKDSGGAIPNRIPSQLMNKKLGEARAASGQIGGIMALRATPQVPQSSEQVTVSAQAPPIAAPTTQADLPLQARSSAAEVAARDSMSAAAPPAALPAAQQRNEPAALAGTGGAAVTGAATESVGAFSRQKAGLKTAQAAAIRKQQLARISSNYLPTRWTVSPDGSTLLRSTDEGRSWDAVNVASNVVLRAVAALGPEIWAGGKAGVLYHSSDLGQHWTQVKPTVNGVVLTADIMSIEFPDPELGKLTTSEGKVWTTSDGGKTWQVQ